MVIISDKHKCAGCGACLNACANNAIKMVDDKDGFWYPEIDINCCVDCGLCESVCPFNDEAISCRKKEFKNQYYSGQLKNKMELDYVSSGGAAFGIEKAVIEKGGVVYGAAQSVVGVVKHIRVDSINELLSISRSKYLQSNINICYRMAQDDLNNGKLVLFTGVGCQIAGLKSFLKREYSNLITADVICHGVPSGKVWESYRSCLENREGAKIRDLIFRDKSAGWENNQYSITLDNGKTLKEKSVDNPFHRGYLLGLYNRPSCGSCVFNLMPRVSDFTFADYWKYNGNMFKESKSLGVSLICINTQKGIDYVSLLQEHIWLEETTEFEAFSSARHLNNEPVEDARRDELLEKLTYDNFYQIWKAYIKEKKPSIFVRIIKKFRRYFI